MTIETISLTSAGEEDFSRGFSKLKEVPSGLGRKTLNQQIRDKAVNPLFQTDSVELQLTPEEIQYLLKVNKILESADFKQEIEKGNIALVLIRPHAENNIRGLNDEEMVDAAIDKFESVGLSTVFQASTVFSSEHVEELAGHTKQRQAELLPSRYAGLGYVFDRWEEFVDLMTSGTITYVYFHSADGKAIEKARGVIGHWDLNRNTTTETLRGEFGMRDPQTGTSDNYSNLVHGSDEPVHALVETNIIITANSRLINNATREKV